jgi:uncharacterized protein (TIGR02246 family)
MLLHRSSKLISVLSVLALTVGCQSQPAAVNPNDPQIVAAVNSVLDKVVAAAAAADADAVLASSTRDDAFTFITDDRMLTGYDEALAAFRTTYALLQKQTSQVIERRTRVLAPDVVLMWGVSEGTYTDKAGFTSPPVGLGSTAVFVRRDGEWRILHFHQSVAE